MKRKKKITQPRSPSEWQEAVDQAEFFLHVDSARKYGLIAGGPKINVARCEELLREGRRRGIRPSPGCVERLARTYSSHAAPRAPEISNLKSPISNSPEAAHA